MALAQDYDYLFKLVIVGDANVGKTQMLSRFIDNQFTLDSKPTVGVQFGTKTIQVGDVAVKNQIWDTAGQQRFRALTSAYYRGAVGAILVFDLSKYQTFHNIQKWIKQVKDHSQLDVDFLLVGNKNDVQNYEVKEESIQNLACKHKILYVATSALTGQNIDVAFCTMIKQILKKFNDNDKKKNSQTTKDQYSTQNKNIHLQNLQSDVHIPVPEITLRKQSKQKSIHKDIHKFAPFQTDLSNIKLKNRPVNDLYVKKKKCC